MQDRQLRLGNDEGDGRSGCDGNKDRAGAGSETGMFHHASGGVARAEANERGGPSPIRAKAGLANGLPIGRTPNRIL